jgi:hypothetical protein
VNYFKFIRSGVDVAPLLEEIDTQESAWAIATGRQDKVRVQRDFGRAPVSSRIGLHDRVRRRNELRALPGNDRAVEAEIAGVPAYRPRLLLLSARPISSRTAEPRGRVF